MGMHGHEVRGDGDVKVWMDYMDANQKVRISSESELHKLHETLL